MSTQRIVKRVQTLYEEQQQDWCTPDFVFGFLEIHNEDVENYLESLDLSFDEQVIVVTGIPAGTTDLANYQIDGGPLDQMVSPTFIEWRHVGEPDTKWQEVKRTDKLPDRVSGDGLPYFEWRGGLVYIAPSTTDVDIRVRCDVLPSVLDNDSADYIKGLLNVLVYGVCKLIAGVRGGPASPLIALFARLEADATDSVESRLIKQEQNVLRRIGGRRSAGGVPRWKAPTG